MAGVEVSRSLPEDLVERILAMLPFPQNSRLGPCRNHGWQDSGLFLPKMTKRKSALQSRFRSRWVSGPQLGIPSVALCLFPGMISSVTTGYLTLGEISIDVFLPEYILIRSDLQIKGAQLFVSNWPEIPFDMPLEYEYHAEYVANLLTRSWKYLPERPPERAECLFKILVAYPSLDMCKVIVFHRHLYLAEICGSESLRVGGDDCELLEYNNVEQDACRKVSSPEGVSLASSPTRDEDGWGFRRPDPEMNISSFHSGLNPFMEV